MIAISNPESAGRSAVATAGAEDFPQPAAPAVALLSHVRLASKSDCIGAVDAEAAMATAALERAWLLQRGASELAQRIVDRRNAATLRVVADNSIKPASSSSFLIPNT